MRFNLSLDTILTAIALTATLILLAPLEKRASLFKTSQGREFLETVEML
jgi:hypothetical protein